VRAVEGTVREVDIMERPPIQSSELDRGARINRAGDLRPHGSRILDPSLHAHPELADRDEQSVDLFSPDMVADLPEPARRYLLHAIQPGTSLARTATLHMTGSIRLGQHLPWLSMAARQTLSPPVGFRWEARIGRWGISFVGADSYAQGQGQTAFRLWDRVPVVRAGGSDVSRSARGRLAIESIWCPASLLPERGARWEAVDAWTVRATLTVDGEAVPLTLTIGPRGNLQSVTIDRWGNVTPDGHYAAIPFGADIFDEHTFGGYTVPSYLAVNWWHDTDSEFHFFTAHVTQATYSPGETGYGGQVQPWSSHSLRSWCSSRTEGDVR
jgi:hypothetical protein